MTHLFSRQAHFVNASILLGALSVWACGAAKSDEENNDGSPAPGGNGELNLLPPPIDLPGGSLSDGFIDTSAAERFTGAPPNCGDGLLQEDEACDHGIADISTVTAPGCWANCLNVDAGYFCSTPGQACTQFAVCGDGVTAFPEQCDDGGTTSGDGCSSNCKYELGFKCANNQADAAGNSLPSSCSATTCGDGLVEGAELCEPSLDAGCTAQCTFAPDCAGNNGCTSACGDGLVLGDEACDDGNTIANDGCSPTCTVEQGYSCAVPDCELDEAGNCVQNVPVVYRDFSDSHSDFGKKGMGVCGGLATGLVESSLDADGKPIPKGRALTDSCMQKLGTEWYRDTDVSVRYNDSIKLYQNESGAYVNRFGPNGEQFYVTATVNIAEFGNCNLVECGPYEGSPAFLPLNDREGRLDDGGDGAAFIVPNGSIVWFTDDGGQVKQGPEPSNALSGNFGFTTEITYWFAFNDDTNATFDFDGDDDVWVFVNGQLAIDLGGRHSAKSDSFTLNGATPSYGMTPGNIYEIKMFHAEREPEGSNFKLTLSGFNAARSECSAQCNDGVIGFGEECDNGDNNVEVGSGVYGSCNTDCKLEGGFCGNGEVDDGEQCDDDSATCLNCRILVLR